jgi:hypothetical protein
MLTSDKITQFTYEEGREEGGNIKKKKMTMMKQEHMQLKQNH